MDGLDPKRYIRTAKVVSLPVGTISQTFVTSGEALERA